MILDPSKSMRAVLKRKTMIMIRISLIRPLKGQLSHLLIKPGDLSSSVVRANSAEEVPRSFDKELTFSTSLIESD